MESIGLRDGPDVRAEEDGEAENGFPVWADGWMVVTILTCILSRGELAGPASGGPGWVAEPRELCS